MLYVIFKLVHVIGAMLLGGGLIGVWLCDLRGRRLRDLARYEEATRAVAVFYDGVVVPGSILCAVSGTVMVVQLGGWVALRAPWTAAMVALFLFEFVEGNTITRLYVMRIRRLTIEAARLGRFTPELSAARGASVPTFTHFLDLPLYLLLVALGVLRPYTWTMFLTGVGVSLAVAGALTYFVPRLGPAELPVSPLSPPSSDLPDPVA